MWEGRTVVCYQFYGNEVLGGSEHGIPSSADVKA